MTELGSENLPLAQLGSTSQTYATEKDDTFRLGTPLAALLMAGGIAGSGILTLPKGLADTGWFGLVLMVFCCTVACYVALLYGRCWDILEQYLGYEGHVRDPILAITEEAIGLKLRRAVSIHFDVTIMFVITLFLLLAAQNMQSLLHGIIYDFSYRAWIVLVTLVLVPFLYPSTPKDFWPAGIFALASTGIADLIVVIQLCINGDNSPPHIKKFKHVKTEVTWTSFFAGLSLIVLSFSGSCAFLTIQQDMRDKKQFPKAVVLCFGLLLIMYLPISVVGYYVCGSSVQSNILQSLPDGAARITAEILITLHMVFAYIIWMNPLSQHMEKVLNIPDEKHSWKRILLRTGLAVISCVIGLVIPDFIIIMDILSAVFLLPLSIILPSVLYLKLKTQPTLCGNSDLPLHVTVGIWEIIIISVVVILGAVYASVCGVIADYS